MSRLPIPAVFRDLVAEPGAARVLLVAAVALGAAGLEPRVYSPGFPSVQAAVRARPETETLILVVTLISAGLLFVGGVLGDADGRRRILLGALAVLFATSLVGLVVTSGPLFLLTRLAGAAAASAVLPFAFALVAMTYSGIGRATAIGVVYAVYGGATAASPVLLTILGPAGPTWPAFAASAAASLIALWFARGRAPDLPAVGRSQRSYVVWTAAWAFAIVVLTASVVGIGSGSGDGLRVVLIVGALAVLLASVVWDRRRRGAADPDHLAIERRPVTVAIVVGVVVGFAEAAPLFQLPLFLDVVLRYGTLVATLATAPFILALIVAGPVAGVLISRFGPRTLIAAGVGAVGVGNLLAALALGPRVPYPTLVLPFVLIGAGFVVATTVRTAIIFASVSRGLPATAAALNEGSVLVGSRIGLVVVTVVTTRLALDAYAGTLGGLDPAARDAAVAAFRDVLTAIGTPELGQIAPTLDPADVARYATAFTMALRVSLAFTGLVALVVAPLTWLALGRRDPLTTVWDHRDERAELAPTPTR